MNWIGFTSSGGHLVEYTPGEWEKLLDTSILPYYMAAFDICQMLQHWRKTEKHTQGRAAEILGISRGYYSLIESDPTINYSHAIYVRIVGQLLKTGAY